MHLAGGCRKSRPEEWHFFQYGSQYSCSLQIGCCRHHKLGFIDDCSNIMYRHLQLAVLLRHSGLSQIPCSKCQEAVFYLFNYHSEYRSDDTPEQIAITQVCLSASGRRDSLLLAASDDGESCHLIVLLNTRRRSFPRLLFFSCFLVCCILFISLNCVCMCSLQSPGIPWKVLPMIFPAAATLQILIAFVLLCWWEKFFPMSPLLLN